MIRTIKKHFNPKTVCALLFAAALIAGALVAALGIKTYAAAPDDAYYLFDDAVTRGRWYEGENSVRANRENRLYGKEGLVIPYHKITGDGQPVKDASEINDFTPESRVNYVEHPDWVSSVSGDIVSAGDNPHGYWNYHEDGTDDNDDASEGALLSVDPTRWNRKDCFQITRRDVNYTVNVTNDDWHRVTVYIGAIHRINDTSPSEYSYISILDMDGNILARADASVYGLGKYYSFVVRGSFIINVIPQKGTPHTYMNGFFFDNAFDGSAIQKTDLTAVVENAKDVRLGWTNNTNSAFAAIYRRASNESYFKRIALVPATETEYVDRSASVCMTYEYKVGAGENRLGRPLGSGVMDFCVPSGSLDVTTAEYARTSVRFSERSYALDSKTDTLYAFVTVMRDVVYGDNGEIINSGVPFEGAEVTFMLGGDLVYDYSTGSESANMNPVLGDGAIADENGQAMLVYTHYFAGEYTLTAVVPLVPDENDPSSGYEGSSDTVTLSIKKPAPAQSVPILMEVTDAVRPGGNLTVFGNYIKAGAALKVAYAPSVGVMAPEIDESAPGLKYFSDKQITVADDQFGTGVMLEFPKGEAPGRYDIWVKNEYGWSKGITLNGVRPLFMNQEASYEGLDIEISGRNFFPTEYGMAAGTLSDVKVKLVRVSSVSGVYDGIEESQIVNIKRGVRYSAADSFTGVAIEESNPYRVTFTTPRVTNYGTFDVLVSSGGEDFRPLARPQKLIVYERKAKNFNEAIFGSVSGGGNDPLGLRVYWAQNLNYSNVFTVPQSYSSETFVSYEQTAELTQMIQEKINKFDADGGGMGGVIYFPRGTYWVDSIILRSGVMIVGESKSATHLKITHPPVEVIDHFHWWLRGDDTNNVGIARLSVSMDDNAKRLPDAVISIGDSSEATWFNSIPKKLHNVFVSDIKINMPLPEKFGDVLGGRGRSGYSGKKNLLIQNFEYEGDHSPLDVAFASYITIRNSSIRMNGLGASMGFKYSFVENTSLVSGNEGSGWSGRSDAYFANNYVSDIGRLVKPDNYGEVVMFEPPGGALTYGTILNATSRGFTVFNEAGKAVREDSPAHYNYFAIMINEGKGTGQLRYFEPKPVAGPDGGIYGNSYAFCEYERDWDIIPDETSRYAIFLPMEGQTVYRNKAERCAKSVLLFSQCKDSLVAENDLKNTEGIGLWVGMDTEGGCGVNLGIRIENNLIDGVSIGTGKGGIVLQSGRPGGRYGGMLTGAVTIRNNTLKNLTSEFLYQSGSEFPRERGIIIKTGMTSGVAQPGDMRYLLIEGNTVENCQYGVWCDNLVYGIVIKNNTFAALESPDYITYYGPTQLHVLADYEFYVMGELDTSISGLYSLNATLPKPAPQDGNAFWGWLLTPSVTEGQAPILEATGMKMKLYAIFGFEVKLDYNYKDGDGNDRGAYKTLVLTSGQKLTNPGNPVRVGYVFGGWFADSECTQALAENASFSSTATLYAKWVSNSPESKPPVTDGAEAGCNSRASAVLPVCLSLVLLAFGTTLIKKRNKHN
ncbi:MAG: InlB B-repeat-containing protein [Clostridiales bacterium]|jgi:uncharacterized repeat protein (TIGR02543 family)|nr:InlB B-repeat-containing protein [Clostridiales bacterium]